MQKYSNSIGTIGLGNTVDYGVGAGQMGNVLPFLSLGVSQTIDALVAGSSHTCALLSGGVKCWG